MVLGLLDSWSLVTLISANLPDQLISAKTVGIHCIHGYTKDYPVATVTVRTDCCAKSHKVRELYRIMEFVRNMERRRLIKPQDILATLQSIPEDESESELQEHVFDSDNDEDFIPQNISSESEDSEGTNPEDIPSTSTGDRAHAVMLPRDHPPGRGQKKSAKRPRNERTTDNDGGEGNATTNTREGESEGILVSADGIQWKPVEIGEHLPGRRDSQNILREAPGPTGYARRNIIIDSPLSAWRLFFNSYILTHIKNYFLHESYMQLHLNSSDGDMAYWANPVNGFISF
ncbi:uncharacterized protein [Phyllobates terribilis]|uniref:uncharacterized protein n=1 Tax=Phyllobates terribilis TaxID=111132 RepID=UPI003CCA7F59